ncbi:MAG: hypothetical protein NC408_01845 [Candidatus Gastranaerophilales bacterium]|nr:hypothetical protein [Candidatus Gastranaerophilales bacterium]MCM1073273.1 hypothetical protein [Bacteroides sp.]
MKLHYFQRYHSKENVVTANTMLLLSRLYSYDANKFYRLLSNFLPEESLANLSFNLQENNGCSIPDAIIEQPSFKFVVETKLYSNFESGQLLCHLKSFKNQDYKILLTLDPKSLDKNLEINLHNQINKYNKENSTNIIHKHLTFKQLINFVRDEIKDRDYDLRVVIDDYEDYCYLEGLIPDSWKRMRVQLAGTTFKLNKELNLYYDNATRGFSDHEYLGLYNQKAVRAIGKINTIVTAVYENEKLKVEVESGNITAGMVEKIKTAIEQSKNFDYDLVNYKHRYFFVDKFYETDFKKVTPYAPMGTRFFDLCDVLQIDNLPDAEKIAKLLCNKTWE